MPPEKCAYALARYSRSPDSVRESVEWVRAHDSQKFLEHFYFQYGHSSIADLGHTVLCFEGISELAATELEDEQLWDGQAKSSRYQDFSKCGWIEPSGLAPDQSAVYRLAANKLIAAYKGVHAAMTDHLRSRLPRPQEMPPDAYERNIAARAFDVARYLLFLGVPTNVGQVTSIRSLERQMQRLRGSEYEELRSLGDEIAQACSIQPDCIWDAAATAEPLCPTLARHVDPACYPGQAANELRQWAEQNLPASARIEPGRVDLVRPASAIADIVATLLYQSTDRPFRELYQFAESCGDAVRNEVIDIAAHSRGRRDDLLRGFRGAPYSYDFTIDIGAWRDLHRHRRCQQFRQPFSARLGFETPAALVEAGLGAAYASAMQEAIGVVHALPEPESHYLVPFGARSRFLFKMDFAEAEYISRLRSGVKGHFSYRQIAWQMKEKMEELEPALGRLIEATPPWIEDPLKR